MNKMISSVVLLAIAGNVLMAGGDIVPVEPVVPEVVVSDGWKYSASLYLWGSGLEGETANGADIDVSFSDIVDNFDFGYMGTFGAQKGKWGFLTDVIYLKVGDKPNTWQQGDGPTLTNIQVKTWVVTPMVTYRVKESDQLSLDLLAGARYLYMQPKLTISPLPEASTSGSVWDGIVGVRAKYDLNEKWFMPFHFDVGAGDTDLTWQAFAGIGYQYENFDVVAGYRHLDWDFDDSGTGGGVFNDLSMSGPIIGAIFKF